MENYVFDNTYLRRTVNFWTDYNRINETHFWSELEKAWWSQCRSFDLINPEFGEFAASVLIDGHKKIRNFIGRSELGCICIGKVRLGKGQFCDRRCVTSTLMLTFHQSARISVPFQYEREIFHF